MNFLKNFGSSGAPAPATNGAKPLGTKNNYFSSLKLQYIYLYKDNNNQTQNKNRRIIKKDKKEKDLQKILSQISSH
jgi:hypothetical protein